MRTSVRVFYYDTDAGGVVHNIAYLRMIEQARTEFAMALGLSFEEIRRTNIHPVVVRTEIDYEHAAVLGDRLEIESRLREVTGARFWVEFEMMRPADGRRIVRCRQALALVQMPQGRVVRLPKGFPHSATLAELGARGTGRAESAGG